MPDIRINEGLIIPQRELAFTCSRSSGPGGQNVNKVSTRVTLSFDIGASSALDEGEKALLALKLRTRITRDGVLKVSSQRCRTQKGNRRAAEERFAELVAGALRKRRPRIRPKIPRAARERRLEMKKMRGALKKQRSTAESD